MKHSLLIAALVAASLAACSKTDAPKPAEAAPAAPAAPAADAAKPADAAAPAPAGEMKK